MCIKKVFRLLFGDGIRLSSGEKDALKKAERKAFLSKAEELAVIRGEKKAVDRYE